MKSYVFLDEEGYVYSSGMSQIIPEGGIEVDEFYDLRPPQIGYKFKLESKEWVDCRGELEQSAEIRMTRNNLLQSTDWTQLPDVPDTIKQSYTEYRQALRDITDQEGFPYNVAWPTKPEV